MTNKILWTICGLLFFIGLALVMKDKLEITEAGKKIFGQSINITEPSLIKHPTRKTSASDPNIYAKAAYLIDLNSFYPMYEKAENEKLPIASTTKMATAIVILENHNNKLQDPVTITSSMINVEGSDIQLKVGEEITVENLLNGLLIMSGNDTAYALAEYFGGKDKFVAEMNDKVLQIGAQNTKYQDPAGLNDEGYSTSKDLALIAAYGLKNKIFADIVKTGTKTVTSTDGRIVHDLKNSNRMMRSEESLYYPYAIGIKTGFTNEAGHVLVSCAENNGHKILGVVLNTEENSLTASAKESKKLLEWGFANWTW